MSYIHLLYPGKGLPEADSVLKHFKDAFDWIEANKSGRIIPAEGVDSEYDAACKSVSDIESNLKKHLKEQRKLLGDASVRICVQRAKFYAIICDLNFCDLCQKFYLCVFADQLCYDWKRLVPSGSA